MDKLRSLQAFAAVVDHGSLTAAAQALGSSVPAVVRLLAALEARLGVPLIRRTTRRQSLTEEGRIYLERVRRILADLDEADQAVSSRHAEPVGSVQLTAPVLFGHMHVVPAVTRFLQRHSRMRVQMLLVDRLVDLVHEGVDLGVRIGTLPDSSLVAQAVGTVRWVVAASPAWLERHGVPQHPLELADAQCIVGVEGRVWNFAVGERTLGVTVTGSLECSLAAPRLEACVQGLGFARFLSYQCAPYLRDQRLRLVLQEFEPSPVQVSIVYPSARLLPLRMRVLIDWLKQELTQSLA